MNVPTRLCDLPIAEAAALLEQGKATSEAVVASCLERIDALEPKVQAWALVDRRGALDAARRCDQEMRDGRRRGPLHGIPMGLKDIIFTAGMKTEAGSRSWAGHVPSYDATCVHRLKEAGAVILGKTHTTEFACYDPAPTRNPWNAAHTPGGSSSGSGAAVAAGMCLAALGTQTGGSTLRPAAYNGVVGLKPQVGRVSTHGLVPVSRAFDHVGILAHTVEDAAIVLQAIAGLDPQNPYTLDEPVPDYRAFVDSQGTAPAIGLVRDYFFEQAGDEMRQHTEAVVERLRKAGAAVRDITLPPSFHGIPDAHMTLLFADCASHHEEVFAARKEQYGPGIRSMVEKGLSIPATAYARALHVHAQACADMASVVRGVDALLTPGATGPAPKDLSTTGNAAMQMPWSHLGYPAVSLPSGLSREGLPLAVQLVGQPRGEAQLFAVARWCEKALGTRLRPPLESLR